MRIAFLEGFEARLRSTGSQHGKAPGKDSNQELGCCEVTMPTTMPLRRPRMCSAANMFTLNARLSCAAETFTDRSDGWVGSEKMWWLITA